MSNQGPDSVRNGIALTGTLHWLFDRGLLSVSEDQKVLLVPQGIPEDLGKLLRPDHRLLLPDAPDQRPHPGFLDWHRRHVFKTA